MSEDRLSDYVSGRLSSEQGARLERAVEGCAQCRKELESLQQTRALLQALPHEPLTRSFVFAEAPAPAVTEGYRAVAAPGFRMPGWAYAGAAAVAGVAVIVFVLSGTVGTWLPQGSEEEFDRVASTASMEMEQAASVPASAAVPQAMPPAQPAAPAEPAVVQSKATEGGSPESAPIPLVDSVERQEAAPEVMAEVEVETEVLVERIVETETEPTPAAGFFAAQAEPTAAPAAAAEPQVAAAGERPIPTAAPVAAAARAAGAGEPEVETPVEAAAQVPEATTGHAGAGAPTPIVKVEVGAIPATPAGEGSSSAGEMDETPTPGPVVQAGGLVPLALAATPVSEETIATPMPQETPQAATPAPTIAAPTATVAAIARAGTVPGPATIDTAPVATEDPESEVTTAAVESRGPSGPSAREGAAGPAGGGGPAGPAGPSGGYGARGPVGTQGDPGAAGAWGPQGPQGPGGTAGRSLSDGLVLTALIAVAAAALILGVATIFLLRLRPGGRSREQIRNLIRL